jgi:hypothetical protein
VRCLTILFPISTYRDGLTRAVFVRIQVVGQAMAVTRMQVHLWTETRRPQVSLPPPVTAIRFTKRTGGSEDGTQSITRDESDLETVV